MDEGLEVGKGGSRGREEQAKVIGSHEMLRWFRGGVLERCLQFIQVISQLGSLPERKYFIHCVIPTVM